MSRDELEACGRQLYGDQWMGPLANALGVRERNVRRWLDGAASIPETCVRAIRSLGEAGLRRLEARDRANPPTGRTLRHLTLESGQLRESPRSEVRDDVIARLRPLVVQAITGERTKIPDVPLDCSLNGGREQDAIALTIWGPGPRDDQQPTPLVMMGVAPTVRGSRELWRALRLNPIVPLANAALPLPPWLCVRVMPGLALHPATWAWISDLERCLAWAWIEELSDEP